MDRERAYEILNKYVKGEDYILHSEAVEAIMRKLALKFDPSNEEVWGTAGLLHDLDEETVDWRNDMSLHGPASIELLKKEEFGNEIIYNAILAHNPINGYKAKSPIEICLLSADPMSGFIMGIAKGYPDKKLKSVKVSSILKRFKEARYCRSANREYMLAIEKLGLSLEEFATLALEALCEIDEKLNL
ncbi:MAG: HD domain-containing protein [Bacilli bacterium]|nr:HD domain-containing protein [Bacilli bacterium]